MPLILAILILVMFCALISFLTRRAAKEKAERRAIENEQADRRTRQQASRACPECGEQILKVAKKCRYCGSNVEVSLDLKEIMNPGDREKIAASMGIPKVHKELRDGFTIYRWDNTEFQSAAAAENARNSRIDSLLQSRTGKR